jgi:hypothetical protein
VSKKPTTLAVNRITIAFALNESPTHALETIAKLAAGYEAEVSCVFIEDADMLRAAGLPFALEVCRATNLVRRVDSSEVERGLKERASAARKLVAEAAELTGAKWSFEVLRQRTAIALLDLAKRTDVMMFAAATSLRSPSRVAPQATISAIHHPSLDESIVVLVDRSAASGRALQVAHKLAEIRHIPVRAVIIAATNAGLDRLRGQLQRMGGVDAAHIRSLCRPQFSDVAAAASAARPATVVLPIALIAGSSERIHALEEAIDSPILIVT